MNSFSESIIIFRFSAMGDVAMSAAVIREFCKQNVDVRVVMVSRDSFAPFFATIPNVIFHNLDAKETHKGLNGLFRLFRELKKYNATAIADLHNNLRSRILSTFFRTSRIQIARLNKNRINKKRITSKENKDLSPLKPVVEAYADVFRTLHYKMALSHQLIKEKQNLPIAYQAFFKRKEQKRIGISPFAQHKPKMYPLQHMEKVIETLSLEGNQLFIFGGGTQEKIVAEEWEKRFSNVENLVSKVPLVDELALISNLDLMVSMDSANMHIASLMGIEVVSIWGATHPYTGFLGYGQNVEDCVQIELYCRPCSVYGNKPCFRGDHACMNGINAGIIIASIKKKLRRDDEKPFTY